MKIKTGLTISTGINCSGLLIKSMPLGLAMLVLFDVPPNIRRAEYCPAGNTVVNILVLLVFCTTVLYYFRKLRWRLPSILACLFVAGYFLYQAVHTYPGQALNYASALFAVLLLWEFLLLDKAGKIKVFCYFRQLMVVVLFLGLLVYGVRVFLGTGLFEYFSFYSQTIADRGYYYLRLGQLYMLEGGYASRLCGPFNEPGVVGTFAALLLIADRFDLRKKGNLVLLAAGVLSFSLAFFILCVGYILLCAATEKRKDWLTCLLLGVLLLAIFLPYLREASPVIEQLASRFTITSDGLAGDNRTNGDYDVFFTGYMQTTDRWLGMGTGAKDSLTRGANLSYKNLIIDYGLLGFGYLLLGLLCLPLAGKWRSRQCLFFVLLFLVSIYQRPHVMTLSYLALLFGGTEYIFAREVRAVESAMADEQVEEDSYLGEVLRV